ncbi:hypothetical protein D3C71_1332250 [compost metagenome]
MTIHKCWECKEEEILEPEYCCSGHECGCYGYPLDPPYCDKCLKIFEERIIKRKLSGGFQYERN